MLGEQAQQTVGNAHHRPGRRGPLPYIPPATTVRRPGPRQDSRCRDCASQRGDVGRPRLGALPGERMDDVRCVAEEHPAAPAPGRRPAEHERPGGALRGRVERAGFGAGGLRRTRRSKAPASIASSDSARSAGSDQTSAYERVGSGRSKGNRARTSGARNHWRATWRCGSVAHQPRGDRLLAVVAALEAGVERVQAWAAPPLRNGRRASRRHRH